LEERWLAPDHEILVVDEAGIIFMSTRSDWRFRATRSLGSEILTKLKRLHQYGDRTYVALPKTAEPNNNIIEISHETPSTNPKASGRSVNQFLFRQCADLS